MPFVQIQRKKTFFIKNTLKIVYKCVYLRILIFIGF